MMLRHLTLVLAAGVLVAACGGDGTTAPPNTGRVRVVHLSPNAPNVDVLVDGAVLADNVAYGTSSEYMPVDVGAHTVEVRVSNTSTIVLTEQVTIGNDADYSMLVYDDLSNLAFETLTDDNSAPPSGTAKVRLIHAAPTAGLVDIYVTAPGADLLNAIPVAVGVDFGEFSSYLQVPADDYQLRVTANGTLNVLIDTGVITLQSGQVRTGIAIDAAGGGPPYDAVILEDVG